MAVHLFSFSYKPINRAVLNKLDGLTTHLYNYFHNIVDNCVYIALELGLWCLTAL